MVPDNEMTDPLKTAFTVSIDAVNKTTTGISAGDRAATIRTLAESSATPSSFSRPGHIFPLRARDEEGGVLARRGHTEATVDVSRALGLAPVGFLCEVCDPWSKEMLRLPALAKLAQELKLPIVSIEDMAVWRARREQLVQPISVYARKLGKGQTREGAAPQPSSAELTSVFQGTHSFSPEGFAAPRITVALHVLHAPEGFAFAQSAASDGGDTPPQGIASPLPVYTHIEAAASTAFGQGGAALAAAHSLAGAAAGAAPQLVAADSVGAACPVFVQHACVVLHAQGGVIADMAAPSEPTTVAAEADSKQQVQGGASFVTAYGMALPPAIDAAISPLQLPENWTQALSGALIHSDNQRTLSSTHSALVAQALAFALGDAVGRPMGPSPEAAGCVVVDQVVWAQDGVLRMPVPRLWAFGSPGEASLQQQVAPAQPLPGTLRESQGEGSATDSAKTPPAAEGHGIRFAVREALVVSA